MAFENEIGIGKQINYAKQLVEEYMSKNKINGQSVVNCFAQIDTRLSALESYVKQCVRKEHEHDF